MIEKAAVRAFIHIIAESSQLENVSRHLVKFPETVDVYEVTGEYDIIAIVNTQSIEEFRSFLKDKILKTPGVKSTVTSIVLHTYKRDGVELEE